MHRLRSIWNSNFNGNLIILWHVYKLIKGENGIPRTTGGSHRDSKINTPIMNQRVTSLTTYTDHHQWENTRTPNAAARKHPTFPQSWLCKCFWETTMVQVPFKFQRHTPLTRRPGGRGAWKAGGWAGILHTRGVKHHVGNTKGLRQGPLLGLGYCPQRFWFFLNCYIF